MRRGKAHDTGDRAGAVEVGIGPPVNFSALDRGGGEGAEIELVTQIAGVDSIEKNLVVIQIAAANEEGSLRAALTGLHHERTGHEPQRAYQVFTEPEVERAEDGSGGTGLRLRRRCSGCGYHDRFADPLRFQHYIALDRVELAGVEIWRLQLAKAVG